MVKTKRKRFIRKVRKHAKKANTRIRYTGPNPELFKKIYDPKKSTRENYKNLGLAVDLTRVNLIPEPDKVPVDEEAEITQEGKLTILNEFGPDVVFEELEVTRPEDAEDDLIDEEEEEEEEEEEVKPQQQDDPSAVFDALFPKVEEAPRPKVIEEHEVEYWKPLLIKYGTNYELMSRDIKLNYYQESAGVCKRKCEIYISTLGLPKAEKKTNINNTKNKNPPGKGATSKSKRK